MSPNLRCRDYYQTQFAGYARYLACGVALDECLHDFLDQRPSVKYTQRHRASGLANADFWWQPANVEGAALASLALARVLHFDDVISTELLDHLAVHHPDQLRWAIRYSSFSRAEIRLSGFICRAAALAMSGRRSLGFASACCCSWNPLKP